MKGLKVLGCILIALLFIFGGCASHPKRTAEVPIVDGVMHLVHPGETLALIAKAYDVSPELIQRTNNIKDPNHLEPGLRLFIPTATEIREVKPAQITEKKKPEKRDGLTHTILPGETLATIAKAYGVSTRELQRVNNIKDPSEIKAGQKIWVPRGKEVKDVENKPVVIKSERPLKEFKNKDDNRVKVAVTPPATKSAKDKIDSATSKAAEKAEKIEKTAEQTVEH